MQPRISVKALIVDAGRILVPMHRDDDGDYFILPGGGQERGETVIAALERECQEELGVAVTVGDLVGARDYIAQHHEFAATDDAHQVELVFRCTLKTGAVPVVGANPDARQIGVKWLALAELDRVRFYPRRLAELLAKSGDRPFGYLGDVN
ncbi:MAG: NUDIX domain-containing protein [Deltaproteobacteria bacterium]